MRHGGKRKGAGRKTPDGVKKPKPKLLTLDDETVRKGMDIGDGNLSSGVRIAVKAYPEKKERR